MTVRHTHTVTIAQGDYRDSFLFTPSAPECAELEATERVRAERGDGFAVSLVEHGSAPATRSRGRLVQALSVGRVRHFYEV